MQRQIAEVEAARDVLLAARDQPRPNDPNVAQTTPTAFELLLQLRSIGPAIASVLWLEGLCRHFDHRRQLAAFSGLAPSPWAQRPHAAP